MTYHVHVAMFSDILDIATCLVVLSSLWIRRRTWLYDWEQPKTFGLALMAVGVIIKAPPIGWLIDLNVLHGLQLLVSHVFILSGIAAMAYSAERKLRPEPDMCRWRVRFISVPWSVGVTTMVAMFVLYQLDKGYTAADWLVYEILTIYFLSLCAYSLWCLFLDPPSRIGAGIYLLAVGFGLIAATCRALLVTVTDHVPDMVLINTASASSAVALSLFAGGAAWMWKMRLRQMNRRGPTKRILPNNM